MTKVDGYLKKLVLWIGIMIRTFLLISLASIAVWNFFADHHKDLKERVIDNLLTTLSSEKLAGLVVELESGRYCTTSKIPPNGCTTA